MEKLCLLMSSPIESPLKNDGKIQFQDNKDKKHHLKPFIVLPLDNKHNVFLSPYQGQWKFLNIPDVRWWDQNNTLINLRDSILCAVQTTGGLFYKERGFLTIRKMFIVFPHVAKFDKKQWANLIFKFGTKLYQLGPSYCLLCGSSWQVTLSTTCQLKTTLQFWHALNSQKLIVFLGRPVGLIQK